MVTKVKKSVRKNKVRAIPESLVNNEPRIFTDADWPVGSVSHQGDLILVRIEAIPKNSKPRAIRQLADGDTQGSRHILTSGRVYTSDADAMVRAIKAVCPRANIDAKYVGPVFETEDGLATIEHPEHGWHHYKGDMCVAVVYQRNLDAEEREQRTRD